MHLLTSMWRVRRVSYQLCLLIYLLLSCGCHHSPKDTKSSSNAEAAEIRTGSVFEHDALRIEILAVDKYPEKWDWRFWPRSSVIKTLTAKPGEEIAVVRVRTTNGGADGACFSSMVAYDTTGGAYESLGRPFCLGGTGDKNFIQGEMDYQFPFIIAKGTQISTIQLRPEVEAFQRSNRRLPTLSFDVSHVNAGGK